LSLIPLEALSAPALQRPDVVCMTTSDALIRTCHTDQAMRALLRVDQWGGAHPATCLRQPLRCPSPPLQTSGPPAATEMQPLVVANKCLGWFRSTVRPSAEIHHHNEPMAHCVPFNHPNPCLLPRRRSWAAEAEALSAKPTCLHRHVLAYRRRA